MANGRIVVAPRQIIPAAVDNMRWDQSVQTFTSAADRDNQFPAPQAGAVCFLEDVRQWFGYANGAWQRIAGAPPVLWTTTRNVDGQAPGGQQASFNSLGIVTPVAGLLQITAGFRWQNTISTNNPSFRIHLDANIIRAPILGSHPVSNGDEWLTLQITTPVTPGSHSVTQSMLPTGTASIGARAGSYLDALYLPT